MGLGWHPCLRESASGNLLAEDFPKKNSGNLRDHRKQYKVTENNLAFLKICCKI
jgi:hypothetical protein